MPMTRVTPAAASGRERVADERPPVAHADDDRDVGASRARSAAACASVMSVNGDRPPIAA